LKINDLSEAGDQPLIRGNVSAICNGEIYNFAELKAKYGFQFESGSDCEILLHLYEKFGNVADFIDELDGVFAFIIHDTEKQLTYGARDPLGVRPMFMGLDYSNNLCTASEAKVLNGLARPDTIKPFPPGTLWDNKSGEFTRWWNPEHNLEDVELTNYDEEEALRTTANLLYKAVCKRMLSDRPIGTFLSGGLDSSLVAAFIMKFLRDQGKEPRLNTFSIGLPGSPDLAYSEIVAAHIESQHHHVEVKMQDCLNALEDVIYATETFDVTTIRASTPMYILSRYIRDNSDDVVIYSGEGSDEVTQGYLYFKK
jgi:asparagine synthase (glutamine-hydrolysing)